MNATSTNEGLPLAVDLRGAAKCLSLSQRTTWQLIRDKRLGCVRVGRRIIVPMTCLQDFLDREARAQAAEQQNKARQEGVQ